MKKNKYSGYKYIFSLIFCFIFIVIPTKLYCQDDLLLGIKLYEYKQDESFFKVSVSLENQSEDTIVIMKPYSIFICAAKLIFEFTNTENQKKFYWYPCRGIPNITGATLKLNNSVMLTKGETYNKIFMILKKDIVTEVGAFPEYDQGNYTLGVKLDYSRLNFETEFIKQVFAGKVESNLILIELL